MRPSSKPRKVANPTHAAKKTLSYLYQLDALHATWLRTHPRPKTFSKGQKHRNSPTYDQLLTKHFDLSLKIFGSGSVLRDLSSSSVLVRKDTLIRYPTTLKQWAGVLGIPWLVGPLAGDKRKRDGPSSVEEGKSRREASNFRPAKRQFTSREAPFTRRYHRRIKSRRATVQRYAEHKAFGIKRLRQRYPGFAVPSYEPDPMDAEDTGPAGQQASPADEPAQPTSTGDTNAAPSPATPNDCEMDDDEPEFAASFPQPKEPSSYPSEPALQGFSSSQVHVTKTVSDMDMSDAEPMAPSASTPSFHTTSEPGEVPGLVMRNMPESEQPSSTPPQPNPRSNGFPGSITSEPKQTVVMDDQVETATLRTPQSQVVTQDADNLPPPQGRNAPRKQEPWAKQSPSKGSFIPYNSPLGLASVVHTPRKAQPSKSTSSVSRTPSPSGESISPAMQSSEPPSPASSSTSYGSGNSVDTGDLHDATNNATKASPEHGTPSSASPATAQAQPHTTAPTPSGSPISQTGEIEDLINELSIKSRKDKSSHTNVQSRPSPTPANAVTNPSSATSAPATTPTSVPDQTSASSSVSSKVSAQPSSTTPTANSSPPIDIEALIGSLSSTSMRREETSVQAAIGLLDLDDLNMTAEDAKKCVQALHNLKDTPHEFSESDRKACKDLLTAILPPGVQTSARFSPVSAKVIKQETVAEGLRSGRLWDVSLNLMFRHDGSCADPKKNKFMNKAKANLNDWPRVFAFCRELLDKGASLHDLFGDAGGYTFRKWLFGESGWVVDNKSFDDYAAGDETAIIPSPTQDLDPNVRADITEVVDSLAEDGHEDDFLRFMQQTVLKMYQSAESEATLADFHSNVLRPCGWCPAEQSESSCMANQSILLAFSLRANPSRVPGLVDLLSKVYLALLKRRYPRLLKWTITPGAAPTSYPLCGCAPHELVLCSSGECRVSRY